MGIRKEWDRINKGVKFENLFADHILKGHFEFDTLINPLEEFCTTTATISKARKWLRIIYFPKARGEKIDDKWSVKNQ